MRRLESFCGENISGHLVFCESFAGSDFARTYNAYKGNAYGLAATLRQTAVFRPRMRSRRVSNLFFAGQLTVPGPGIPPAVISGQVAADCLHRHLQLAG
jgi:phytoene desaturase